MEWLESIRETIDYIENNLLEINDISGIADKVYMSPMYLQKGFKLMTGYSVAEYIRNRRLYLAALEILADNTKVIDVAYKYGYDTPESFTKAFSRFHKVTPTQIRKDISKVNVFLPLKISISIKGGSEMDYTVEKMKGFKVIGFEREFSYENAYEEVPKFWGEIFGKYIAPLCEKDKPEGNLEETICNCHVGEFGVNLDNSPENGKFRYIIGGEYTQGDVPDGMVVHEFSDMQWAKFMCKGPMPGALQSVNTKIFKEWLPNNQDYEIATGANIEWYSGEGNTTDPDYESAIWIPVKKRI